MASRRSSESQSATEAALIWKGRKSAFGATGRIADYICMDGTVPLGQLSYVLKKTSEIVDGYGLRVANVFHAGDGNMHPLILYNINDPEDAARAEAAGNDILKLCVDAGGCLTGEHGVGIEKRDLMRHQFTQADLDQQMAVRAAFDPAMDHEPVQGLSARRAPRRMIPIFEPETEAEAAAIVREHAAQWPDAESAAATPAPASAIRSKRRTGSFRREN